MIKGFLPMLYVGAGVVAASAVGYAVMNPEILSGPGEETVGLVDPASQQAEPAEEQVASLPATNAEEAAPSPVTPAFTLLRVEKDGSTVIAGTGPGRSEIRLFDGEARIATTTSGTEGDFAIVLDNPLKPGLHELHLLAITPEKAEVASTEAGIINVPEPEAPEAPTVLVSEAGEATRVLQQPQAEPKPEEVVEKNEEKVEEQVAAVTPEPVVSEPKPEAEAVTEPAGEPKPVLSVLIEAADIESEKLFIAGKGEPGEAVNIYFENELLGQSVIGSNGVFLFEKQHVVEPGRHAVRADMVDRQSGSVLARAEVELLHQPEVVVAVTPEPVQEVEPAPAPAAEPAPAQETETVAGSTPEPQPTVRKVIRTGSAVIIRRGDNLWRVATRNYGEGLRYTTIFEANRDQVRDPDLIYPGQVLKIPENEQSEG